MTKLGQGKNLGASALLLLAAAIWGFGFVAQRVGMTHVGPLLFNGVRFLLGAFVLVPILLLRRPPRSSRDPRAVVGLLASGFVLALAANLQQFGLVSTEAGKAGFITGLYVVFVPILGILRGQRIAWSMAVAVPLSVAGLYLLSIAGPLGMTSGDLWILLGALVWAVHVQLIGWLVERRDAIEIAIVQFSICGLASLLGSVFFERISVAGLAAASGAIAYSGVLSVGVAFTLQVMGQQTVDPSRAGVLLSLEAAFAILGGWMVLGEHLSTRALVGCGLMLAAMILAQFDARRFRRPADASGSLAP
jgi:drug/metabolite transporter (DMT)-like permease